MLEKLSIAIERMTTDPKVKQEKRQLIRALISDQIDISILNLMLNYEEVVNDLKLLKEVQLYNKDVIYYDAETNHVRIKSTLD